MSSLQSTEQPRAARRNRTGSNKATDRGREQEDKIIETLKKEPEVYTINYLAGHLNLSPSSVHSALIRIEQRRGIAITEHPDNGRLALYQDYGEVPYNGAF